jgi:biopolymer transport protein ExbB
MAFSYYKACTIQSSQVPSSQAGFPALLPFLDSNDNDLRSVGNGGHVQSANGYDIRPYSDSGLTTPLTFELVSYDATTGKFEMWVNMTAADSAVVYVAYGNSALTSDGSSTSTWDSNFKGVWHLPNGSSLTVNDSTSNAKNATNVGTATAVAGKVDGAASFNGSSQYLTIPTGIEVGNQTAYTIEGWVNTSSSAGGEIYSEGGSGSNTPVVHININDAGTGDIEFFHRADDTTAATIDFAASLNDGAWHHIAGVRASASSFILYVDGASQGTSGSNPGTTTTDQSSIAVLRRSSNTLFLNGKVDEVRVSYTGRSADWIATVFNNATLSTFWSKAGETAVGGSPNNPWYYYQQLQ